MKRLAMAAAVAAGISPVHAQEREHDAIVVTATRLETDTTRPPGNVAVITAEDIANSPAQSLPELLATEAGVFARSLYGNNAARADVDLRGFGATGTQNTLVLLDGRRLNDIDLSGVDFAAIPLDNIERIEIVRSGGAVLYGDGTAGGTINIITRGPGAEGDDGTVAASLGSYGTRRGEASFTRTAGLGSMHLFASRLTSDGYRDNNALRQTNVQGDARRFTDNGQWYVKFGADDQYLGLPGARTVDPSLGVDELASDRRGTGTPDDFAEQRGAHITIGTTHYLANEAELVIDGGLRHKRQEAFLDDYVGFPPFFPPGTFANFVDTRLNTWSLTPRLRIPFRAGDREHVLQAGLDLYYSDYVSERGQRPDTDPIHHLDVTQRTMAVYARDVVNLGAATELSAGARLQHVRQASRDRHDPTAPGQPFGGSQAAPLDRTDTEPMLELGLRYALDPQLSLFAKLERSARFATVDELFEFNSSLAVQEFSPLNPQTGVHLDVGADFEQNATRLSAAAFYMHLDDEIHFDPVSFSNVNLEPTRRYGVELSAQRQLSPAWWLRASYGRMRAEFRDGPNSGNEVPLVPRDTAALSLRWQAAPELQLSALVRYVGEQRLDNDQANTARPIPAYSLVDLQAVRTWKDWELDLQIHNLFDEQAFGYGVASTVTAGRFNAYPLPERSASATLRYRF